MWIENTISYTSHEIKIEDFQTRWLEKVLQKFEREWYSSNLKWFLDLWEKNIGQNIHYDALNYAISVWYNAEDDLWIWVSRIPIERIRLTKEQKEILIRHLRQFQMRDNPELSWIIKTLIWFVDSENYIWFTKLLSNYPSLQKLLWEDANLWREWQKYYYSVPMDTMIINGVGNCKTYALLLKLLIENASKKWKFWVKQVTLHENIDGHVVLRIDTHQWIQTYDPLLPIYWK